MSYFSDWYDGEEPENKIEWDECFNCGAYFPMTQEFCYKCLSTEDKWKLGIL